MAKSTVMTGARAKLGVINGGAVKYIGIYNSFGWDVTYDVQGAWILGRLSAACTEYTSAELVNIRASAYRVIGHGPHADGQVPTLQDILNFDSLEFDVFDRLNPLVPIAKIIDVRPTGYSESFAARSLTEINLPYVGILVRDETATKNDEPSDSSFLPS